MDKFAAKITAGKAGLRNIDEKYSLEYFTADDVNNNAPSSTTTITNVFNNPSGDEIANEVSRLPQTGGYGVGQSMSTWG